MDHALLRPSTKEIRFAVAAKRKHSQVTSDYTSMDSLESTRQTVATAVSANKFAPFLTRLVVAAQR